MRQRGKLFRTACWKNNINNKSSPLVETMDERHINSKVKTPKKKKKTKKRTRADINGSFSPQEHNPRYVFFLNFFLTYYKYLSAALAIFSSYNIKSDELSLALISTVLQ